MLGVEVLLGLLEALAGTESNLGGVRWYNLFGSRAHTELMSWQHMGAYPFSLQEEGGAFSSIFLPARSSVIF